MGSTLFGARDKPKGKSNDISTSQADSKSQSNDTSSTETCHGDSKQTNSVSEAPDPVAELVDRVQVSM